MEILEFSSGDKVVFSARLLLISRRSLTALAALPVDWGVFDHLVALADPVGTAAVVWPLTAVLAALLLPFLTGRWPPSAGSVVRGLLSTVGRPRAYPGRPPQARHHAPTMNPLPDTASATATQETSEAILPRSLYWGPASLQQRQLATGRRLRAGTSPWSWSGNAYLT